MDAYGNRLAYDYADDGRLLTISDEHGRALELTYTSRGHVRTVEDHTGRTWQYDYDLDGNLVAVTNPEGGTRRYSYSPFSPQHDSMVYYQLTRVTDEAGVVLTSVNYNNSRVSDYTEGENRWDYRYAPNDRTTRKTDRRGAEYVFHYNEHGDIIERIDPAGRRHRSARDANGNVIAETDPSGATWEMVRDALGRITEIADPLDAVTRYVYDTELPDPNLIVSPTGRETKVDYNAAGSPIRVEDPQGAVTRFEWSEQGDLIRIVDADGEQTEFTYNPIGLPLTVTDPLGRTTQLSYDAIGNLVAVENAAGETTRFEYDALGRVVRTRDPLGSTTRYAYDPAGRWLALTDAGGNTTRFVYDDYGRRIARVWPDENQETYAYRNDNRLVTVTRLNGIAVTYSYDVAGRLIREDAGDEWTDYAYDDRGLLIRAENPTGIVNRSYDAAGRLSEELVNGETVSIARNAEGERVRLSALDQTVEYARDARGLVTRITDALGDYQVSYDALGRRTRLTQPNGATTHYDYDAAGQLTQLAHNGPFTADYRYSHDAAGRLTRWRGDDAHDWQYAYDAAGRLVEALYGDTAYTYDYDALGNRLEHGGVYDANNRLLEDGEYSYSYDANGNLTEQRHKGSGVVTRYTWNAHDQLIAVARDADPAPEGAPSATLSYTYGPLGRRWSRTVDGATERFVYDGLDRVGVLDGNGSVQSRTTFGPLIDEPLATEDFLRGPRYYHANHQRSVMALTDAGGTVTARYGYSPYGVTEARAPDPSDDPFRYTGREYELEGLYYYRARYYLPNLGRFAAEDPIGFSGGDVNLYGYVEGDPVNYVDPHGLAAQGVVIGVGIRIIGGRAAVNGIASAARRHGPGAMVAACLLAGVCSFNEADTNGQEGGSCPSGGSDTQSDSQRGNPFHGPPGGWVEHPHGKQDRLYGPDGTPAVDIDYGHDHGQGSPHAHNWDRGVRGPGVPVSPIPR
ncbi:RHS repeat-associated core domain-containing protein [Alkalilimnicola ehrlichii]|uniref:Teneurin-like YD-shell domain-containing protein n=1 Tax=Alkalilimnicola ehrlichii TaxID=351052 RepID=A0A3E0WYI4_9GAMM|nr:RHS repeat-associated core domain-containing protein [Alkalilimnicola ehrlichii]RFA37449.1 hypothetical protein CAL65_09185 [Alkalilimnicola ehrlichii]